MLFSACALDSTITKANEPKVGPEQNPPQWPDSVTVIKRNMSREAAQEALDSLQDPHVKVTSDMTDEDEFIGTNMFTPDNHFSNERRVIFFEPREEPYKLDVQVAYYVQLAGLGESAGDVKFEDAPGGLGYGPYCPPYYCKGAKPVNAGQSLDTFWRSMENFTNNTSNGLLWAVSQAAPLRRVHAMKGLKLSQGAAPSSGGHLANAQVDGTLEFGSQQQFCSRSVTIGDAGNIKLGAWSNVFVDTVAPKGSVVPNQDLKTQPKTTRKNWDGSIDDDGAACTVNTPTVTVEKCFVAMGKGKDSDRYFLHVPSPRVRIDSIPQGADLSGETDERREFERVFVAKASLDDGEDDLDVARKINMALGQGKDVVLSPGIYKLSESISMNKYDQVLLGVGMATLESPTTGEPCIRVAPRTEGVRINGIMFAASKISKKLFFPAKTTSFIEFGKEGVSDPGNPNNPGVLTDIFCRVGGAGSDREVSTDVMVRIHSGNVLGDNLWLWRADHVGLADGELPNFPDMGLEYHQTVLGECAVKTGLEVNGDNVVIHGLAVEHTTEDQVVWNGNNGQVYFYQCELPYDVDVDYGTKNYVGFRVTGENHELGGAGVYCNFRDFNVLTKTGIAHPDAFDGEKVANPFCVHLNNQGRIMTVVSNGKKLGGGPVHATFDKNGNPAAMVSKYLPKE